MDDGDAPDSRGERLYQRSWVSQQPGWCLDLFRIWWLNGAVAAVVCGWAIGAWTDETPADAWPVTVLGAALVLVSLLQFRSWRRDRLPRTPKREWTTPWLD